MTLYALPCPKCKLYCPVREIDIQQVGQLGIVCSEHGDTPLYTEVDGQMIPLTWADLMEVEGDDAYDDLRKGHDCF